MGIGWDGMDNVDTRKSQTATTTGSHTDNEVTSLSTLSSPECRLQATLWQRYGVDSCNERRERGERREERERYHIQIGIGIVVTATVG